VRLRRAVIPAAILAVLAALSGALLLRPVEVNPITPSIEVGQDRVPVGGALEITYVWTLEPGAKRLEQDYRALVRFVDDQDVTLFDDDHAPAPPASAWQPGETYRYTRTIFVPLLPYTGPVEVRMGLYPLPGRGQRPVLMGVDRGSREYGVARIELRPQTDNVYLYYKEGWYNPEKVPEKPTVERQWTKKEAVVAFRNPNLKLEKPTDVIVYLRGETCVKCFPRDPTLTVSVGNRVGRRFLIDGPQEHLWKIRVRANDLGAEEWTDLRLAMDQSFVPKDLYPPLNNDARQLGFSVSHLSVAEAAPLGSPEGVEEAVPLDPGGPQGSSAPQGP
jgi:hypothetical protein